MVGVITTTVKYNDWLAKDVKVTVLEDGNRPIIGNDLVQHIGLSANQSRQVLNVNQNQCSIKQRTALDSPGLIS